MKRTVSILTTALAALATALVPSPAEAAYCGIRWGSLPKADLTGSTGQVVDVRAGRHACFDRLVLDVAGDLDGYAVRYVPTVKHDGSGEVVPLRGGARLGHAQALDHMFLDGLEDAYDKGRLMGTFAEDCATEFQFTRSAQDEYALASLGRARAAQDSGAFAAEIAAALGISVRTVNNLLQRAYVKLGVSGRRELADRLDPR